MKHVGIYLRVSSGKQDTKSQEPDLRHWVSKHKGKVRWYKDVGSGRSMDRSGWKKLEAAMQRGEVSAVVCWRLDRIGRTCRGLSKLFHELGERRINLLSIRDSFDLSNPAGRLMAHVLASVAQYESELIAERVVAGQKVAKKKGEKWGGANFAVRKSDKRKRVTPEKLETIRYLKEKGTKLAVIARTVGLSRPTVYQLLADNDVK